MTREEAIGMIRNDMKLHHDNLSGQYRQALNMAIEALKEKQPEKGYWMPVTNGRGGNECSVCHNYAPSFQDGSEHLSKFCPDCGSDMRKDGDGE